VGKCLFCDADLSPGSEEHVFLSALGGRLVTSKATCGVCNNDFANDITGKLDDAFAENFVHVRNALRIWSGRNKPPPTINRDGKLSGGIEYDLAPGMVPVVRKAQLPDTSLLLEGTSHRVVARDIEDSKRVLKILSKRDINVKVSGALRVQEKAPQTEFNISIHGPTTFRAAAKAAVLSVCVLYGNEQTHEEIDSDLFSAIKNGHPDICLYAGWEYTNCWPIIKDVAPHKRTPSAHLSGFEHSVMITDVNDGWIAYVEFFGGFRFSIRLGASSGLPNRGLSVNPRSSKPERFVILAEPPAKYCSKNQESYKTEFDFVSNGYNNAFDRVLNQWQQESRKDYFQKLSQELLTQIATAHSEETRISIIRDWAGKVAALEMGNSWAEDMDLSFNEDDDG